MKQETDYTPKLGKNPKINLYKRAIKDTETFVNKINPFYENYKKYVL